MKLSCLLAPEKVSKSMDKEIKTITASSKEADAASVFVCLSGHHTDGHLYWKDAYENGCRVFVCDKKVTLPDDSYILKTEDIKKTAWNLLSKLYGYPQQKMTFIGVTGTKGKTTVVSFINTILDKSGIQNAAVGTLGAICNGKTQETPNTTPDMFFLFPLLAKWRDIGVSIVTLEMSSQSLADERLSFLPIKVGVFTCLGMDHIGSFEHADFRAYYQAKRKLFSDFPLAFALVNDDDIYSETVTNTGIVRYTVSLNHPADYSARVKDFDIDKMSYIYQNRLYSLALPGEHQLHNALLACRAVSRLLDYPMEDLLPLLADAKIDGRFERFSIEGKCVIVDYAHNATSFYAVSALCRKLFCGSLYAVFGSVGDRVKDRRRDLAKMGERMCNLCVLTTDNPDFENPYRICAEMQDAFIDKTKAKVICNRKEAVKYAISIAQPGDVVLLLGKGRESYQKEHGILVPYSEIEAVFSSVSS